ncbi:MAG: magnesium transporter CorA family protein [Elusimicrobiota bacterium]|nr:magnesium transporter CorA family protein [Elusimicrobiota bacterium]
MIKNYKLKDNRLHEDKAPDCPIIVAVNPGKEEREALAKKHNIDEHNIISALDPEEPARIEFDEGHLAFIFKRPKNYSSTDHFVFKVSSMGLFLFDKKLVIIVSEDLPLFKSKNFRHVKNIKEIFLKLIYNSIFHFLEHLRIINMIADEIEKKLSRSMENKYLLNMFSLEKSLVYYLNAISSNGAVVTKIKLNSRKIGFSEDNMDFIDDMMIENNQCYRQAEIYSNIFASMMDARASIVNNNLNVLMKNLNVIVIGLMVPTMVVSIFSMNVALPFQHDNHAFIIVLGLCTIALGLFTLWWKNKKW